MVGMCFGFAELYPMGFQFGADLQKLSLLADREEKETQRKCLSLFETSSANNREIVEKKKRFLKGTVVFVAVALVCYAGAVVVLFLSLLHAAPVNAMGGASTSQVTIDLSESIE